MRDKHYVFKEPGPATILWRYFDFPKFCSLLQMEALYFCRADLLGDPLEGSLLKSDLAARRISLEQLPDGIPAAFMKRFARRIKGGGDQKAHRKEFFVSSWHAGDHESMAMWRGYGDGYGVAIRTTAEHLDQAVPKRAIPVREITQVFVGHVDYIDYTSETSSVVNPGNIYAYFMSKSMPYRNEQEVRAVFWDPAQSRPKAGHYVKVDLRTLVRTVVVSPLATKWFEDVISGIVHKYGFDFEVTSSVAMRKLIR